MTLVPYQLHSPHYLQLETLHMSSVHVFIFATVEIQAIGWLIDKQSTLMSLDPLTGFLL